MRQIRLLGITALAVAACLAVLVTTAAAAPAPPIRMGFCGGDDWEPDVAADGLGHVYVVWTHYVGDTTCDPASASPHSTYIQVSNDGGLTFGPAHAVAPQPGGIDYPKQADPTVVIGANGTIFVGFLAYGLNGGHTDVYVARSTDFGASFTATKINTHDCKNCDHEKLVTSGSDVYAAYSQATNHFIAHSSDGGATWTEANVLRAGVVAFVESGVVDAAGNAWFAWADCQSSSCSGVPAADFRVSKTLAGTLTTTFTTVASGTQGPDCPFSKCGFDYFGPQDDIAIDAAGTLYLAWQQGQAPPVRASPPVVQLSRSTNGGQTWSHVGRVDDKNASGCAASSCYALFPQIVGGLAGQLYAAWMDDRNGNPIDHTNGWNVWLRTSTTGGTTWAGPSQRIAQFDPTQSQSGPNGFLFPYGDYFGLVLSPSCGKPLLTWGEGHNWVGGPSDPGHVEFRSLC
jgi:hypothetical protein